MRNALIVGLAVICAALILSTGGLDAQNVKTVQVTGVVDVGNLPAIQNVAGTVDVGNLPLDADGNLRVAGNLNAAPREIRFIGFTAELPYDPSFPISTALANSECHAAFPSSRVCGWEEFILQIPPVPVDPNQPCVMTALRNSNGIVVDVTQLRDLVTPALVVCVANEALTEFPIACCGF